MASFDIESKIDIQTLDNAVNAAKKEIDQRYDFKGSNSSIELDKKTLIIQVITEHEMKMEAIEDIIISRLVKQKLDPRCLDFGKDRYSSGKQIRKDIKIKQGIDRDTAKKIVKHIKDLNLKVQASIMDEQLRVTAKKIDDLQACISACKAHDFEIPLQFVNMKS